MARKKSSSDDSKKGAPEWMTTYGDMVTLLLCFFVLLFSFSEIDAKKFEAIMRSFQGSLGVLDKGRTIEIKDYVTEATTEELMEDLVEELEELKKLQEKIENYLGENDLDADVLVSLENRGLVLRFQDNVLFDSTSSRIKEDSKQILIHIAALLNEEALSTKLIRVEGHTDSDQLRPWDPYATNWELSVARATNVVRFLAETQGIEPSRLVASGYSEYSPVAPNDTRENKARNRRVDIVVLRSESNVLMPLD